MGVHQVTVIGTVIPASAQVVVNGQAAKVSGGIFRQTAYVSGPDQQITVSGAAHGYLGAKATTVISYSTGVAAQLVAATPKMTPSSSSLTPRASAQVSSDQASAINAAFALPGQAGSGSTSPSGPTKKTSTVTPPSSTPPNSPGHTGGSAPSGSSGSSGGGASSPPAPSSHPTPPPPPTPAQIAAQIKTWWDHTCITRRKGENVVPYCTCTYVHLSKAGALSTRDRLHALLRRLRPYERTGDFTKLPRFVRTAVTACVAKYPPADPLTGRGKLNQMPELNHPGQPQSNQPISPGP